MRKELLLTSLVVAALSVFFMNEMIRIDYNLNLIEYISLSRAYTDSEKEILKKYGTLTYGGNIMEPPLGKYYDDTGQYLGLVTDMIYALAIELETDIVMRPLVWNEALNALETGSIDLCDLTPSSERARRYIFTDRIYDLNGVALVRKDQIERIKDISDLEGMRVGVQNGDYIIESLSAQNVFPIYVETDNLTRAMDLLKQGEVDRWSGSR